MAGFGTDLRRARSSVGLRLADLADRSGIPEVTLKAYEMGRRHPTRGRVERLVAALRLDRSATNDMLIAAGFAPDGRSSPTRFMSEEEAIAEIRLRPWPALVMSETIEMHAVNDLLLALWGLDVPRLRDPVRRSVLSMVAEPTLAERCLNWDEAVANIISIFKGHRGAHESLDAPSAYFAAILDEINRGEARLVRRFVELWERTPGVVPAKVAWSYPIVWRVPHIGTMRFHCVANSVNEVDSLDIDDWFPADAPSHRTLERLRVAM